jgi:hypothetical protein
MKEDRMDLRTTEAEFRAAGQPEQSGGPYG